MEKVCIIGFGKLGSHLYYSLNGTKNFHINYKVRNSNSKINPSKFNSCSTIFICTADSDISKVVIEISGKKFHLKNKFVFHTSGALDSEILNPLKKRGAYTGSFHPVQTFESKVTGHNKRLNGIYFAVEGHGKAVKKAYEITRALHSRAVIINRNNKVLHHINSVFASNYMVVLISLIEKISQKLSITYGRKKILKNGFNKISFFNIYKPLIEQTLINVENKGTLKSLTGPIDRNDLETVKLHLDTLKKRLPLLLPFYILLGNEAVEIAAKKRSLRAKDANAVKSLLNKYLIFSKSKKKKN